MSSKEKVLVQQYKCNLCGREKTVRIKYTSQKDLVNPITYGSCPRCKKGTMYAKWMNVNDDELIVALKKHLQNKGVIENESNKN